MRSMAGDVLQQARSSNGNREGALGYAFWLSVVNPYLQAGNADPKDSSTFDVDAAKKVFAFFNATALEVGLWSAVEACINTADVYKQYVDSDNAKHPGTAYFAWHPEFWSLSALRC